MHYLYVDGVHLVKQLAEGMVYFLVVKVNLFWGFLVEPDENQVGKRDADHLMYIFYQLTTARGRVKTVGLLDNAALLLLATGRGMEGVQVLFNLDDHLFHYILIMGSDGMRTLFKKTEVNHES